MTTWVTNDASPIKLTSEKADPKHLGKICGLDGVAGACTKPIEQLFELQDAAFRFKRVLPWRPIRPNFFANRGG
jgi:hypothetical protein